MIDNQNTKKLLLKGGRIIDPFSKKTLEMFLVQLRQLKPCQICICQ